MRAKNIHDFMRDIQGMFEHKDEDGNNDPQYILILASLNNYIQVVMEPVISLTLSGVKVENPERYVYIMNDLKETAIKIMVKNNLRPVQKYIDEHSDTKEAQFLSGLMNKLNINATSIDYCNILMSAKNAVAQLPVPAPKSSKRPPWAKKSSLTDQNSESYRQACNEIIKCMEILIAECSVFEYPADSEGKISTAAFEQWNNGHHLDAAAINNPGATIIDITRDVKIGEKGIFDFDLEVILEDKKIRKLALEKLNEILGGIKDPEMLKAATKLLGMSIDQIKHGQASSVHLQNMIKHYPIKGNGKAEELFNIIKVQIFDQREQLAKDAGYEIPGHFDEKKRLIQILRALDDGLMLGDAYAKVYKEYEEVYDMCQALKAKHPEWKNEIDVITHTAKALLLAHSRDYAELIKGADGYQIKEPKVIINQVKQAAEILQKNLDKFQSSGENGAFVLDELVKKLLVARAEVVKKYPDKVAVKEELLSVKQNVQNNLYPNEVEQSFSLQGKPVSPAGPEMQNIAIVFDGKGGAFIQLKVQQDKFFSDDKMIAMNEEGRVFQIDTNKEPRRPDLLSVQMQVHLAAVKDPRAEKGTVPEVAATLTGLKFTLGSSDLKFTPKGGKAVEKDVELELRPH